MSRHLLGVHKNEREVVEALAFEKDKKKKNKMLEKVTLTGNFAHNLKVLEKNEGELKVVFLKTRCNTMIRM